MKAIYLVKNGKASGAFELRDIKELTPSTDQVLIETEAFGLNFADVMSRLGYYKACPPLPAVIGYDVVGRIKEIGNNVKDLKVGQRVIALTRFGGYATHVLTQCHGVVPISEEANAAEATALTTQYSTAYYAAYVTMQIHEGEHVLIHAAAGGVGTALTQLVKRKKCIIYGTAGSEEKLDYIKKQGVDFPINYRKENFYDKISSLRGDKKIDVIFDSIGGNYVKKGINILAPGGRMAMYGAAQIAGSNDRKSLVRQLRTLFSFGKYRPTQFIAGSQSLIGINMLPLGDYKPQILQKCIKSVVELYERKEIKPVVGKIFNYNQIGEAHEFLQKRQSVGKIVIKW